MPRHSEEANQKMSETKKRQYQENPEKWKEAGSKISEAITGGKRTEEQRRRMSEAAKKRWREKPGKVTEDQKRKLSESMQRYWEENPKAEEHRQSVMEAQARTWLGRSHAEEARKKQSDYALNRPKEHNQKLSERTSKYFEEHPEAREYLAALQTGKKLSEETKRKLSERFTGDGNNQWRGGISFEPYGPEFTRLFKEIIRERDRFTCQECGRTQEEEGRRLCIHHVDYDKLNNSLDNVLALCNKCNVKANYNRVNWEKHYRRLMATRER